MAARLITELDVTRRALSGASEPLVVDADTVITPAALDAAARLGVRIDWRGRRGDGLLSAADVDRAAAGRPLDVDPGTLITPLARDRAAQRAIEIAVRSVRPRAEIPPSAEGTKPSAPAEATPACPACAGGPAPDGEPRASIPPSRLRVDVLRDLFSPRGEDGAC